MKKSFISKMIAVVLALMLISGGAAASADATDSEKTESVSADNPVSSSNEESDDPMAIYLDAYEPVFENCRAYYSGVERPSNGANPEDFPFFSYTIPYGELDMGRYPIDFNAALNDIGYMLQDISGDNIPELIIGKLESPNDDPYLKGIIYDMFTLQNGSPKRVLASSARVRFRLCSDNLILNDGSGGASSQSTVLYRFNGTEKEFVKAVMMAQPYYYEVTTEREGIYQPAEGDTMLSESEYSEKNNEMFANVIALELTPIPGVAGTGSPLNHENGENNFLQYEGFWVSGADVTSESNDPWFVNMLGLAFQDSTHLLIHVWIYRVYNSDDLIFVDFDPSTGVGTFESDHESGTIILADNHVSLHMEFGKYSAYYPQDITFDKYSDDPETNPAVSISHPDYWCNPQYWH